MAGTQIKKRQLDDNALHLGLVFIDNTDSPYSTPSGIGTVHVDPTTAVVTVNLPAVSSDNTGRRITVRDETGTAATNNITLDANGADTIDGAATLILSSNRAVVTLESDGVSEWAVVERN